ncbi:MoaD/ThiS family protein [Sulfobacillus thermosulfidooxidans]|uniref:Molybdopterin synthase sulfur carrier subunit n=1 Tax=Sulfobacillus thermosulfidooxidans (strain DSM 9293 / VKM B-1269 / AT-1) TaxID=929705 RepID=A0A1W1W8S0_SULTA|nr:MoaD/ThiS family protein [Sulfobacillus thermosulfidooxidans]SMC02143.1 molybdopterin synthase sulfur carrier subunit [Sulfobacillus thermosulfidooxidans DSM 9293]
MPSEITVLFFSFAADRMNTREKTYELPKELSVKEFFQQYLYPSLKEPLESWLFSVNEEWVDPHYALKPGDELAVVPPVSGG